MSNSHRRLIDLQQGLDVIPRAPQGELELYVVDSAWLAPIINDALVRMKEEPHPRGFHKIEVNEVTPHMWLAASLHTSQRRIYRIQHGIGRVGLSFADALLLTLGLEHLVSDMPAYPNPRIPRVKWIARAKEAGVVHAAREWREHAR